MFSFTVSSSDLHCTTLVCFILLHHCDQYVLPESVVFRKEKNKLIEILDKQTIADAVAIDEPQEFCGTSENKSDQTAFYTHGWFNNSINN